MRHAGKTCAKTAHTAFHACGFDVRGDALIGHARGSNVTNVVASCRGDGLETHEDSPLEPGASESPFYAEDAGVILTLDDDDPSFREELVSFTPGS